MYLRFNRITHYAHDPSYQKITARMQHSLLVEISPTILLPRNILVLYLFLSYRSFSLSLPLTTFRLSTFSQKAALIRESSVALFTGIHRGPLIGPGGKTIPPTNKKFQVEFCTVAHWKNGKIDEENLFYDQVGMMKQLGLA
jgi:SnoaL-like polyketide cyclase